MRRTLLPGNAKILAKTELPVQIALEALDKSWLSENHLTEIKMMGMLWTLISGSDVGKSVEVMIDKILAREGKEILESEISWLRGVMPSVIDALMVTPNNKLDNAIMQLMTEKR